MKKTRDDCMSGILSYNKKLMLTFGNKRIALLFLSTGIKKVNHEICENMIYDYHEKNICNSILMIVFTKYGNDQFDIDWLLADFDNA